MARPTDCTPDTIARVCEALELGVSWAAAAAHAGLAEQTLITWRKRGQTGKQPVTLDHCEQFGPFVRLVPEEESQW